MYSPLDYGTACTYPLELAGASIRESSAPLSRRAPPLESTRSPGSNKFLPFAPENAVIRSTFTISLDTTCFLDWVGLVCGSLGKIGFDECVGISRGIKFETRRSGCRSRFVPARSVPTQNSPPSPALPFRFTDSRKDARHGQTDPPFTGHLASRKQTRFRSGFRVVASLFTNFYSTLLRILDESFAETTLPTFSCSEQTGSTWA